MTSGSTFGDTISRPPTSWSRSTSSGVSTVPAPIRISAGAFFTAIAMERNGSGELSGISIAVMPCSIRTSTMPSASSGFTPRRIATSGRFIGGNGTGFMRLILLQSPDGLGRPMARPRRTASSESMDWTATERLSNANRYSSCSLPDATKVMPRFRLDRRPVPPPIRGRSGFPIFSRGPRRGCRPNRS